MSYLEFKEMPAAFKSGKTKVFAVLNTLAQIPLGTVRFHGAWRKYVFMPEDRTIFDPDCLQEILVFTREQTTKWRESL